MVRPRRRGRARAVPPGRMSKAQFIRSLPFDLPAGEGPTVRRVFLVETGQPVTCGADNRFTFALSLRFERDDGALPGPGTYEVGAEAGDRVEVAGVGCDPVTGLVNTSGTVTLSVADDRLVEGQLDLQHDEGAASGTFRAHICPGGTTFACQ